MHPFQNQKKISLKNSQIKSDKNSSNDLIFYFYHFITNFIHLLNTFYKNYWFLQYQSRSFTSFCYSSISSFKISKFYYFSYTAWIIEFSMSSFILLSSEMFIFCIYWCTFWKSSFYNLSLSCFSRNHLIAP